MSEERIKVLQMLADGKLTAEQANQLLEALEEDQALEVQDLPAQPEHTTADKDVLAADALHAAFTPDQLIAMRSVDMTPKYIQAMRESGYRDVNVKQLIDMRAVDVTPDFINAMRDVGISDLPPDQLIDMRAVDISPDFVKQIKALGYSELSVAQLIDMKAAGVDPAFVHSMRDHVRK